MKGIYICIFFPIQIYPILTVTMGEKSHIARAPQEKKKYFETL